jgi:hypothetical protein
MAHNGRETLGSVLFMLMECWVETGLLCPMGPLTNRTATGSFSDENLVTRRTSPGSSNLNPALMEDESIVSCVQKQVPQTQLFIRFSAILKVSAGRTQLLFSERSVCGSIPTWDQH